MRTLLPALLLAPSLLLAETFAGAPVALDFGPEVSVGRKAILAGLATLYLPRIADALGAPFDYAAPITLHVTEAADADHRRGYADAALLLDHLVRTRHNGDARALLHPLNAVCRRGEDGAAWLARTYGDPDALMGEIRAAAKAAPAR